MCDFNERSALLILIILICSNEYQSGNKNNNRNCLLKRIIMQNSNISSIKNTISKKPFMLNIL